MLTGKGLAEYAAGKVGTPYFYGAKMEILTNSLMATMHRLYPGTVTDSYMSKAKIRGQVGRINVDCSGLIGAYRGKQIGSSQLYQTAYTRLSVKDYQRWADGVVCWRSGHVGVFSKENGKCYVYEAKGIDYGTVRSTFNPSKWSYGLTFKDIDYTYTEPVQDKTWKASNPFPEPSKAVKRGMKGNDVKWVQFELSEAGYTLDVDGDFGQITDSALRDFQRSCKIEVDGICGSVTRKYLKADSQSVVPEQYQYGVDVSKYQGEIDWTKVKAAGMSFAVLKVTKKNNEVEEAFEQNYNGCRLNQIPMAVYRYVYATSMAKAEEEARAIVEVLRDHPIEGEVWLDMEDKSISGIGKSALTLIIDQEAKILKAAGYKVGIYCNRDWFEHTLEGIELLQRYKFWIAKYGKNDGTWANRDDCPKDIAYAWQYTSKGRVNGITGDVDLNLIF